MEQTQTADKAKTPAKATKVTNPSKAKAKGKKLADLNIAKSAKDTKSDKPATFTRELLYKYPADVRTKDEKKVFRRKARAQRASFEKVIDKLTKSNDAKDKKELGKVQKEKTLWEKETLNKAKA